ncbi:MAG: DUF4931 domain-containing protein [Patescibacteria group bacterium]
MVRIPPVKSEIREDYIHNRFVIIAPKRAKRPHDVAEHRDTPVKSKDCPFCREREHASQRPLYQVGPDQWWEIKVIKNIFPVVSTQTPKTYGTQEVIIETPHHNKELADFSEAHIVRLLKAYANRTEEISRDKKMKYILIFKNHGGKAGASLVHAHSQIFASGFMPPHIVNKLTRAEQHQLNFGACYYCQLARRESRGPRRIGSDRYMAAFTPYASTYNYEAWIMPKRHVDNISLLNDAELTSLAHYMQLIIKRLNKLQLPYNYYLHQAITEKHEHLYIRICPRRDVWAGVEMGSRLVINSVAPEAAAKFYRGGK